MMKILVSTTQTQGQAPGDFCYLPEGEPVARYDMVCDSERPDGSGCGCGRAFSGLTSRRATTTAMVVESPMTEEEWRAALHQALTDSGWAGAMPADELAGLIDEIVELDLRAIASLPAGTVLGRRAYNEWNGATSDTLLLRSDAAA